MRLRITKCKNTDIFYVIKTIYVNEKQKTKTVEEIGNTAKVKQKSNGEVLYIWVKKHIDELLFCCYYYIMVISISDKNLIKLCKKSSPILILLIFF